MRYVITSEGLPVCEVSDDAESGGIYVHNDAGVQKVAHADDVAVRHAFIEGVSLGVKIIATRVLKVPYNERTVLEEDGGG